MAVITVPDADYSDRFAIATTALHTAEEWGRAAFEPASLWDATQLVWRRVLQLRLGPLDDPARVAGWEVAENADDRMVLVADSWHLAARVVLEAGPTEARITTEVTYRNPAGRAVWALLAPVHRRAVPDILAVARRRVSR
jgi:hypothetical protein